MRLYADGEWEGKHNEWNAPRHLGVKETGYPRAGTQLEDMVTAVHVVGP
jgi:hypothetical protein